jgi:DNA-binding MarR family transcriptional regulator
MAWALPLDSEGHAGHVSPSMKAKKTPEPTLSWDEIGFLCHGMSFASRPMAEATGDITEEYSLGPRGAWMLVLIDVGNVYPLDIANVFRIGRSLISAELVRLTDAGLITSVQSPTDGRRTELRLTPLGETVRDRVRQQLRDLVTKQLAHYSRDELMLCARILSDFRGGGRPEDGSKR